MSPALVDQLHDAVRDDDLVRAEQLLDDHPDLVRVRGGFGDYPTALVPLWKRDPPADCGSDCDYEQNKEGGRNASGFAGRSNGPMLELLLSRGAPLDIGLACLTGKLECVTESLGDDPDLVRQPAPWAEGSLIQWAAWGNQPAVIDVLFEHGASVDVVADDGQSPLHKAAYFGCDAAVARLIHHGADIYAEEPTAQATPLVWAVLRGHRHTARCLIETGYDVNKPLDEDGNTLWHRESRFIDDYPREFLRFSRTLLALGADAKLPRADGTTVLDLVRRTGNERLVSLFEDHA